MASGSGSGSGEVKDGIAYSEKRDAVVVYMGHAEGHESPLFLQRPPMDPHLAGVKRLLVLGVSIDPMANAAGITLTHGVVFGIGLR